MLGAVLFYLVMIALWVAGLVGWIINLVAVVKLFLASAPLTTLFIGKIIGVPVFPLGALLGWFA